MQPQPQVVRRMARKFPLIGMTRGTAPVEHLVARDDLAASTIGYSPASIERLFDEALLTYRFWKTDTAPLPVPP
mgnify:CR=1 FL=1